MINEGLIANKVMSGHSITDAERNSLSPYMLAFLASGKNITLTRAERNRIDESLLASLVIGNHARLDPGEINRFSPSIRFIVEDWIRSNCQR